MDIRVLGPLEVEVNGQLVDLGALKERTLLAVLLLHANEAVSSERLADELWGARPPPSAPKLVQTYVSHLRKFVPVAIETRPPGYALRVEPDALDVTRFEWLVERATGEPAEVASRTLCEALALWRGSAFEGISFESFAAQETERLEDARLTAVALRIDADLALGRHEQLVAELKALVARHRFRERLRAQLMVALYRSGRQADALAVYREGARMLGEELGLEPGPELRAVEASILRQDESVAPPHQPVAQLRHRRVGWVSVGIVAAATAVLAIAAFTASSGGHASVGVTAHSLAQIDPRAGAVIADIPVLGAPTHDAATRDALWAVDEQAGTLFRIDPTTRTVTRTIPVGNDVTDVLATRRAVWVLAARDNRLVEIDPASDRVLARFPVAVRTSAFSDTAIDSAGLADARRYLYINGVTTAWKVDSRTGKIVDHISEDGFAACAVAAGALWTVDTRSVAEAPPRLERRDLHTNAVTGSLDLTSVPAGVVATPGGVWVVGTNGQLLQLDPKQLTVQASTDIGGRPSSVAVVGDSLWIADAAGNRLVRVDGDTGRITARIRLTAQPGGLATDGHSLWLTLP
jgi:DNA-binding SARP family transcriptional activator/DNA-binding beta-propeller fold protein YncE